MSAKSTDEPTPIQLATPGETEFEVWVDSGSLPPSVLIIMRLAGEATLRIIDPSASNAEVLSSTHYLDIVAYLREEDYSPVKGRMKFPELDADKGLLKSVHY